MCMSTRTRVVLVKPEPTEGTDSVPVVGTDDLYILDNGTDTIQQQIAVQTIGAASPDGASRLTLLQSRKPTATLRIPAYVEGVDGSSNVQTPRWMSVVLQSVGVVEAEDATPSTYVRWHPDSAAPRSIAGGVTTTAGRKSFTMYEWIGREGSIVGGTKMLRKMLGCRVTAIRIVQTVNEPLIFEVDILGRYVIDATSTADLSGWTDDGVTTDIPLVIGGTNQFQASAQTPTISSTITLQTSSLTDTIAFGGEHVEGDDSGSGVACIGLTGGIEASLTANPILKASDIGAWASFVDALQHAKVTNSVAYAPQGASTAGKRITITRPNVQGVGEPTRDGAAMRRALQLAAHHLAAGASEYAQAPISIEIT